MSRQARLGLVVIVGLLGAVGFMFVIASQGNLLGSSFGLRSQFNNIGGLLPGAKVLYGGYGVGRVTGIQLPNAPGQPITVFMQVDEEVRPLIREDSRAAIQTDGLVGNVIVSLTPGSPDLPEVATNGVLEGVDPFAISAVTDRLFASVSRFDSLTLNLTDITSDIRSGQGTLGQFLYDEALYDNTVATTEEFQNTLRTFTTRADALVSVAEDASQSVDQILAKVNTGGGTVARFLNEDDVYETFLETAQQLQAGAAQLQTVSADVRAITDRFNQAAGFATLGAFRFAELMEAGKHNFLFRGYFEDRGYYEMAPFEVRERAIAETLADLQEWERRLLAQQQEIDAALLELERRGITLPDAPPSGAATPVVPPPVVPNADVPPRPAPVQTGGAADGQ
ncbi:MlaD family protein [Rubrivirga sp. S365]|uniref:MlaD family protein n=1 Tax=Rubrivirga sp. S365 TaxID=3076080 RepID=UPI0028C70031|nr:MlaD family protein [Rubrivirga sp. S365]MDT7856524.1 MlaD family protein [Rubrivirga sp. S365]